MPAKAARLGPGSARGRARSAVAAIAGRKHANGSFRRPRRARAAAALARASRRSRLCGGLGRTPRAETGSRAGRRALAILAGLLTSASLAAPAQAAFAPLDQPGPKLD